MAATHREGNINFTHTFSELVHLFLFGKVHLKIFCFEGGIVICV